MNKIFNKVANLAEVFGDEVTNSIATDYPGSLVTVRQMTVNYDKRTISICATVNDGVADKLINTEFKY